MARANQNMSGVNENIYFHSLLYENKMKKNSLFMNKFRSIYNKYTICSYLHYTHIHVFIYLFGRKIHKLFGSFEYGGAKQYLYIKVL